MIPDITNITNLGAKADPKAVAAKVQGMFLEVILKTMEDSVDAEGGLFGSNASSDIYRGMLREHLADALARQLMDLQLSGPGDPADYADAFVRAVGGRADINASRLTFR